MQFHYVYILQSIPDAARFYVGHTADLRQRLDDHNHGGCTYTSTFRPWRIKMAIAFTNEARALAFEHYLKSPSGRAFAKKRL